MFTLFCSTMILLQNFFLIMFCKCIDPGNEAISASVICYIFVLGLICKVVVVNLAVNLYIYEVTVMKLSCNISFSFPRFKVVSIFRCIDVSLNS